MDTATIRRLVLKYLALHGPRFQGRIVKIQLGVGELFAKENGLWRPGRSSDGREFLKREDYDGINEAVWDLVIGRVLTLGRDDDPGLPELNLTDFGLEVVKEERWSPFDPQGYLVELSLQAPKLATLSRMYVAEALNCFRSGSYLATAVMLGAASEGNMLDLFNRFGGAMRRAGMPEHSGYQEKLGKAHSFYDKYRLFRKYFDQVRSKLPGRLVDDLDGQMDGVLHLIRAYRNEAGHPTGTKIERMDAFRSLVLFVPYCRRVEELGDWLESNFDKLEL